MKNEMMRKSGNRDYDFFEDALQDFFPALYGRGHGQKYMRTDIREDDAQYIMEVELPGMEKKDIRIDLKDGYLNISANKSENGEENQKDRYIHRERSVSCRRSYYVGDVRREDIKAKYENGILSVVIPKETAKAKEERVIEIE